MLKPLCLHTSLRPEHEFHFVVQVLPYVQHDKRILSLNPVPDISDLFCDEIPICFGLESESLTNATARHLPGRRRHWHRERLQFFFLQPNLLCYLLSPNSGSIFACGKNARRESIPQPSRRRRLESGSNKHSAFFGSSLNTAVSAHHIFSSTDVK